MITWRTVYKNGTRKFLRCAIGARRIQVRIIPGIRTVGRVWEGTENDSVRCHVVQNQAQSSLHRYTRGE